MSKSGRATGPPLARRLRWLAEAGPAWLIYGLMRALPLDWASALVGRVFRLLGPRLALSEKARASLRRAFPEKPEPEIESILREVWDNLGRTVGELAHLDRLIAQGDDARIEVVGRELLERYKRDDPACLTFAAHLANWELCGLVAAQHALPMHFVYRRTNNPYVNRLVQHCRRPQQATYIAKGPRALPAVTRAMRAGKFVGMLVDQKLNNGVPSAFFGRTAMTSPLPAICKLRYDCHLLPVQVERLAGAHFRLTIHPPMSFELTGDHEADVQMITASINRVVEGWVRQRPGQWFWLHRRWPD